MMDSNYTNGNYSELLLTSKRLFFVYYSWLLYLSFEYRSLIIIIDHCHYDECKSVIKLLFFCALFFMFHSSTLGTSKTFTVQDTTRQHDFRCVTLRTVPLFLSVYQIPISLSGVGSSLVCSLSVIVTIELTPLRFWDCCEDDGTGGAADWQQNTSTDRPINIYIIQFIHFALGRVVDDILSRDYYYQQQQLAIQRALTESQ